MNYLSYIFFRVNVAVFAVLPFPVIYMLSDILSFFLRSVVKYRYTVVSQNLDQTNLGLSAEQKKKLIKKIYTNLSDIIVEGIKGNSLSRNTLIKRYSVVNPEILREYYKKGQDVIGVAPHYGNWEWGVRSLALQLDHSIVGVYKALSNKYIDQYIKRTRAKDKTILVEMKDTREAFENEEYKPGAYVLVSDQNPSNIKDAHWITFLGKETAVIHGPEKYSRKYNLPVVFAHISRIRRGYYEVSLEIITSSPENLKTGELSYKFMKKLEKTIMEKPENWLWTHKRWKHVLSDKGKLLHF